MILPSDIWLYNLEVVLGSIPSQAHFILPPNLCESWFTIEQNQDPAIQEVVYSCWGVAVPTFLGNITAAACHVTEIKLFFLPAASVCVCVSVNSFRVKFSSVDSRKLIPFGTRPL